MLTVNNHAKERLKAGALALGVGLRQARTADIGLAMKTAGFDWLFIDMEHNSMGIDIACQISVAAQSAGITPLIRVPGFEHHLASRALDGGAQGIVFPHVDDAATAEKLVSACLYPPMGKRSIVGALPQIAFASHPMGEAAAALNASALVVMMIESPEGVHNAEAIAAVPGVDALLIGTSDLSLEMGIPGDFTNPQITEAYEHVIAACAKHNKHPGMGGVYTPELIQPHIERGMRLVLTGNDLSFMMQAGAQQARTLRGMVPSA